MWRTGPIAFMRVMTAMRLQHINQAMTSASALMWQTALVFLAFFLVCLGLSLADPRTFQGVSLWLKPAKFFLSLAVHLITVTAALLLIPEKFRRQWPVRLAAAVLVAMAVFEVVYITFRAARGEASHYNESTELAEMLYSAMGVGAVLIIASTVAVGGIVLRYGPPSLLARTTGWSFILASAATMWSGSEMAAMDSHWIGGDETDATGVPFVGWSTTGGDLRPAHFIGLHVMQILPLVALTGSRAAVLVSGFICAAGFAATAAMALNGIPVFPRG